MAWCLLKDKLAYFRIKELKDILNQLGLPKQGKKQDLVERVLALLSDEQGQRHHGWGRKNALTREAVAKVVDDTYRLDRKMQVQCAPDLASRSHSGSDFSHFRPKEEANDYYHVETKVRCLCSSTMLNDNMIQCEDAKCQVWQHMTCVLIPDKPTEGVSPEVPPHFYCEMCRLSRADPFLVTTGNPLLPVKFMSSGVGNDGTNVSQSVEKTFQLSRSDRETVQRQEYELQVWCILINDKVQFRMQWPQYAELQVNGIPVRVVTRPGSQLLGINGRDDGPMVTTCSREGINKISLSRVDTRTFCFGVRIVRKRTFAQVLNLIPKEGEGESFVDALARVRRCLGGGGATDNADSDSDLEVVTESVTVNLRCPLRNCNEDVNELDVKPDGSWRVKGDAAPRELCQWHMPDGTLCDSKEDTSPAVENLNEFKREEDRQQQQQHNAADVIVLSDSDEENDTVIRQPAVYDNTATNGNTFPFATNGAGSGYPERYQEDAGVGTSGLDCCALTFAIIYDRLPLSQARTMTDPTEQI
nr:unnamed protein product [Digitaria exilis]